MSKKLIIKEGNSEPRRHFLPITPQLKERIQKIAKAKHRRIGEVAQELIEFALEKLK